MFGQFPGMSDLLEEIAASCHKLLRHACNPYRPELHYMRGPGPKWQAKHGCPALDSNQSGAGR